MGASDVCREISHNSPREKQPTGAKSAISFLVPAVCCENGTTLGSFCEGRQRERQKISEEKRMTVVKHRWNHKKEKKRKEQKRETHTV
jgi:hypothetical protein